MCDDCEKEPKEVSALQPKLSVGQAGDPYEQEADRVADQVADNMHASNAPSIQTWLETVPSRITPLVMREGGGSVAVSPRVEQGIQHTRGAGEAITQPVRVSMQQALGADFSGVRIHANGEADSLNRSLNARAFTTGKDIYFKGGEYQPESPAGQKLLAHELAHVVQQGAADNTIRRKILIDGKYYIPSQDYDWIRKSYGEAMIEFLKTMHNNGNPPEFRFDNYKQMHYEIRVRSQAIKGMEKTAGTCCSYPSAHAGGYLDAAFWDKKGPFHFAMKSPLPSGKTPSDAIEAIFKDGAGSELECNSMMTAVQYRSVLQAIGATRFNARFPAGAGVVIKPVLVDLSSGSIGTDLPNSLKTEKLYQRVSLSGFAELLPGDWVYFLNVPDYPVKHPGGFWTGEHAMYLGNDKFSGFGLYGLTNDAIINELLKNYNKGLPPSEQKKVSDVPGILPQVIRRPVVESYVK